MSKLFLISDTHFFHEAMINRLQTGSGEYVRSRFSSVEEMNETIIKNWNDVVSADDRVIHLGDFAWHSAGTDAIESIIKRLNGKKKMLYGNHDAGLFGFYRKFFDVDVYAKMAYNEQRLELCHFPIHTDSSYFNEQILFVHGHTHNNLIKSDGHIPRYVNVCVECIGYKPILFDNLIKASYDQYNALKNHNGRVDLAYQDLKDKTYATKKEANQKN